METDRLIYSDNEAIVRFKSDETSLYPGFSYEADGKYDICFVFEALADRQAMLAWTKVESFFLQACTARDYCLSTMNSVAVIMDRGIESLPDYYEMNMSIKDQPMTRNAIRTKFVHIFKKLIREKLGGYVTETRSTDSLHIFIFVKLPEDSARNIADKMKYPLQLDTAACGGLYSKDSDYASPFVHYDKRIEDKLLGMHCSRKFGMAFQRYDEDGFRTIYKSGEQQSIFTDVDRARLLLLGLSDYFNLEFLIEIDLLKSYYMPANHRKVMRLQQSWATWKRLLQSQPLDEVRDYFGEEIALYFAWVQEFRKSLLIPVLAGLTFFIMKFHWSNDHSLDRFWINLARVALSITTTTWCAWFNQRWEFVQELLALRWGSSKLDSAIARRQECQSYRADVCKKDPVNPDREIKWYSTRKWRVRRIVSNSVSFLCLVVTVILVNNDIHEWLLGQLGVRDRIAATLETFIIPDFVKTFASPDWILVALLVYVFDLTYNKIAYRLVHFENHKYYKTYQQSLVRKLFLFSAFDYFIPLYHLAFTKMYINPCWDEDPEEGRCVKSLHSQIQWICIISLAGNFMELGIPYLVSRWKIWNKARQAIELGASLRSFELDFCRQQYDGTMEDYQEVILMYLLLALFTTIFSLLPLAIFIFVTLETRVDSIKLLKLTRRPFPRTCRNVGAWRGVMSTVSNITIITNICLCTFTTFGKPYPLAKKLSFTLITTMSCFSMREFVRWVKPPLQHQVDLLKQKQAVAEYVAMWGSNTDAAEILKLPRAQL